MTRKFSGVLLGCVLALAGCAKSPPAIVPVEGVVLLNNQPLPNAMVQFIPMIDGFGAEYIASGITDANGRFKVACPLKEGAAAAESVVTVEEASPPDNARGMSGEAQAALTRYMNGLKNRPIPPAYGSAAKSPLKVTVTAGQTEYKLELKR